MSNYPHELVQKFKRNNDEYEQVKEEFAEIERKRERYREFLDGALGNYLRYRMEEEFPGLDVSIPDSHLSKWVRGEREDIIFKYFKRPHETGHYWYDFKNNVWMNQYNSQDRIANDGDKPNVDIKEFVEFIAQLSEEIDVPLGYEGVNNEE